MRGDAFSCVRRAPFCGSDVGIKCENKSQHERNRRHAD
jgi:hypothetical protein